MMTLLSPADNDAFPIRTVAAMTGINPATLRTWERRYRLVEPGRTPKGHRQYSKKQIAMLHRVVALLERGVAISHINFSLIAAEHVSGSRHEQAFWNRLLQRLMTAIAHFDDGVIENIYNEALALYPAKTVTRKLLLPVLDSLGERGTADEGSIAEEYFFGLYLRNKLSGRLRQRKRREQGPRLITACFPGERHEAGILLFALDAVEHGYRCISLGSQVPLEELAYAAKQAQAQGIVLFASQTSPAAQFGKALTQLCHEAGVPVFVGGPSSVILADMVQQAGATALGADNGSGFRRIAARLNDGGRPSATDKNKNTIKQISQENSCSSQV